MSRVLRLCALCLGSAAVLLAGCSDEPGNPTSTPGTAEPTTTAAATTDPSPGEDLDGLEGIHACDLMTDAEAATIDGDLGSGQDGGKTGGELTTACDWQKEAGAEGFGIGITTRPGQDVASYRVEGGATAEAGEFNGRTALLVRGATVCELVLAVGERSRVDIGVLAGTDTDFACDLVDQVATIIDPKLPPEGGA